MGYALAIGIVVAAVYGLVKLTTGGRYAKMTEKEFEAEAQRGSRIGGAALEIQKVFGPSHHVEYVQQRDKHVEPDAAESGDRPETGSSDGIKDLTSGQS